MNPKNKSRQVVLSTGLSRMEQRFVDEYIIDLNPEHAAIRMGFQANQSLTKSKGFLKLKRVNEAINAAILKRRNTNELTAQKVIKQIAAIAFLDPLKVFNGDGSVKPLDEIDEETRIAIMGVEEKISGKGAYAQRYAVYKVADKLKALEDLARYFGLFQDNVKIKGDLNVQHMPDHELDELITKFAAEAGISRSLN